MENGKIFIGGFVVLVIAICVILALKVNRQQQQISDQQQLVSDQQKQISQLCSAEFLMLCASKPGLEERNYKNLGSGSYVVRFINFGNGTAVFEPLMCSSKEERTHYAVVCDIPPNVSKNWACDQVVTIPAVKSPN
jgi:hypothetical protein